MRSDRAGPPDALAVPQQAVRHNETGGSEVFVVREDNRDGFARVRLGRAIGDRWLILDVVKPGGRIIAEGFQNLRPDVVSPRPWSDRGSALSADANLNGSKRCVWASIAGR
jgi:membrane fusion protein, multidrug efflux system